MRLSAALSYYTVFSLTPLLLFVLMACGTIFGEEAVQGQIQTQLSGIMGAKPAEAVQSLLVSSSNKNTGFLSMTVSLVALLFGASGIFSEIKDALNRIWGAPENKDVKAIWNWTRAKMQSFGMVLVILFLLVMSLAFSTSLSFAAKYLSSQFSIHPGVWTALAFVFGVFLEAALFAMLFRVLPDVQFPWRDTLWGALATAILFEIGKWGLSWYIGRQAADSASGAAGSLLLVLMWIYYSSIIVLTGAEVTQVHSRMVSGDAQAA
jgi:membrane protein